MIEKELKRIETSKEKCIEFIERDFQHQREDCYYSYYLHREYPGLKAVLLRAQAFSNVKIKFYFKDEVIAILYSPNHANDEIIFFPEMSDDITGSKERAAHRIVKLFEKKLAAQKREK